MNETELEGTSAAALAAAAAIAATATVTEREEYVGRGTVERNAAQPRDFERVRCRNCQRSDFEVWRTTRSS